MAQECWIGKVGQSQLIYRCSVCGRLFKERKEVQKHEPNCTSGMTKEERIRRASKMSVGRWFKYIADDTIIFVAEYFNHTNLPECKLKVIKELRDNLIQSTVIAKKFSELMDEGGLVEIETVDAMNRIMLITDKVRQANEKK